MVKYSKIKVSRTCSLFMWCTGGGVIRMRLSATAPERQRATQVILTDKCKLEPYKAPRQDKLFSPETDNPL